MTDSVVNKNSQLALNASLRNYQNLIQKANMVLFKRILVELGSISVMKRMRSLRILVFLQATKSVIKQMAVVLCRDN